MEPIGQKTSLTSSEEAIFTTDLEVESGENETEKILIQLLTKCWQKKLIMKTC